MIKKIVKYVDEDNGFEYTFEPLKNTKILVKETKDGYEVQYIIQDEIFNIEQDDELFLVNYHRDFWVEKKDIVSQDEICNWHKGRTIPQQKQYYILPLACLVHSGVWLKAGWGDFMGDPQGWDTSHVGAIFISKGIAKNIKKAESLAEGLVKDWNDYLEGNVFCVVTEYYNKNKKPIDYDICGGFLGLESVKEFLEK